MKGFGIVGLTAIPGRLEPSDKSEMITQLLFGETYEVLEEKKKWIQIKNYFDEYVCWIDKKQFIEVSHHDFDEHQLNSFPKVADSVSVAESDEGKMYLPAGASLPWFSKGKFKIRQNRFSSDCKVGPLENNELAEFSKSFLNTPYLWGGKTHFGIDCSGLVQVVFSLADIKLQRDAYQQAEQGESVAFIDEAQTGNLAFFDNEEGKITHVGIVLETENGNKEIIHASGKVRQDKLDHQGIFDVSKKEYTHQLRLIKCYW